MNCTFKQKYQNISSANVVFIIFKQTYQPPLSTFSSIVNRFVSGVNVNLYSTYKSGVFFNKKTFFEVSDNMHKPRAESSFQF